MTWSRRYAAPSTRSGSATHHVVALAVAPLWRVGSPWNSPGYDHPDDDTEPITVRRVYQPASWAAV